MTSRMLAHTAAVLCDAPADAAFATLASPTKLGQWTLGCVDAVPVSENVVRGRSLFDGSDTFVRVDPDPLRRTVDYAVGDAPEALVTRISARVVPGAEIGETPARCLVVLLAWRPATMEDERWHRLVASHEVEILLLRHCIEREVVTE